MSRVGKQPVSLPSGVKANINESQIEIEGPKGKLALPLLPLVKVDIEEGQIIFSGETGSRQSKANWGTLRSRVSNSIVGVTTGWSKNLELQGVGFTAALKGSTVTLATGYSHKTDVEIPSGVTVKVEKQSISLESCDRELVGRVAAQLRDVCPPEPYLGKGVRYANEHVRRKAGKTGAK